MKILMKKYKFEILSILVTLFVFSLTMVVNEILIREKTVTGIRLKVGRYEKLADSFTLTTTVINEQEIIKKLNNLRNVIIWNADGFVSSSERSIRYPVIVNESGRNLEDKLILVNSSNLKGAKSIIPDGEQLILVFPFYMSKNLHYLLIPMRATKHLKVLPQKVDQLSLRDKFSYTIPLFSESFTYYPLFLLFALILTNFLAVRYYRLRLELVEKSKVHNHYIKLVMNIKKLKDELKFHKRKLYSCQFSLKVSNNNLTKQATSYVNNYKFIGELLKSLPVKDRIILKTEAKSVQIKGILSKKLTGLDSILSSVLEAFKDNIQNSQITIVTEHNGEGIIIADEDFIFSIATMAISNILMTALTSQTIKMTTVLNEKNLVISFVGSFSANIKDYKYPSFLEVSLSSTQKVATKEIIIPSIIPILSKEKPKKNDNIVPLFNN